MARKRHKGASPKIQTAEGWRRQVRRETGKKIFPCPPGNEGATSTK